MTGVAFSPDGTVIVSGAGDGSIQLWKASTGEPLKAFKGHLVKGQPFFP